MKNIITIIGGIVVTGLILDIAGSGTLGRFPKDIADRVTNGYGKG